MNDGTDGISKMTKHIHTHPNTTSHFDARSRQRRRSSAEQPDRCLRGSWYMGRHCRLPGPGREILYDNHAVAGSARLCP